MAWRSEYDAAARAWRPVLYDDTGNWLLDSLMYVADENLCNGLIDTELIPHGADRGMPEFVQRRDHGIT